MSEVTYTDLQLRFLKAIKNNFNYDYMEGNITDNCTPVTDEEVASWLGISKKQAEGLLTSCHNKGLLSCEVVTSTKLVKVRGGYRHRIVNDPLYMATELCIREHYRLYA